MATFIKTPAANLDYSLDYATYLSNGERITASSWSIPSELTETSSSFTNNACTIFISGGVNGKSYQITNTITFTNDVDTRTDSRQFTLVIANRDD